MGVESYKARKSSNYKRKLDIIKTFNQILLILSLMGLMYALGLCNGGQCVYIEERELFTGEILTIPPVNFELAQLIQVITTWLVMGYVGTGVYLWKMKRNTTV